jgi:uncharacterized protein (TIGR02246 family)
MTDNLSDDQFRLDRENEIVELRRTHDIMVSKRDQLEQGFAELKASLEEKQRATEDVAREVSELRRENVVLREELEKFRNVAPDGSLSLKEQPAIEAVVARLEVAWTTADADAFAAEFTHDADFVNIRGEYFSGRTSITWGHANIWHGAYAGSTVRYGLSRLRELRPGVLLAHVEAALHVPAGPMAGDIQAIPSMVLVFDKDTWRIAAFHNTTRQS